MIALFELFNARNAKNSKNLEALRVKSENIVVLALRLHARRFFDT
jgi:hypothetical protein